MDLYSFKQVFGLERQPAWIALEVDGSIIASGNYGVAPLQEESEILAVLGRQSSRVSALRITNTVVISEPGDSLFENLYPGNISPLGTHMSAVDRGSGRIHVVDLNSGESSLRLSLPDTTILAGMTDREQSTLGTQHAALMKPATVHAAFFEGKDSLLILAEFATLTSDTIEGRPRLSLAGKSILVRYFMNTHRWSTPQSAIVSDGTPRAYSLHNARLQRGKLLIGNPLYRSPFPAYDSIRTFSVYDLKTRQLTESLKPDTVYSRAAITYGLMDTYGAFVGSRLYAVQRLGATLNEVVSGASVSLAGGDFTDPGSSLPTISKDSVALEKPSKRMARIMAYSYANSVHDFIAVNDHLALAYFLRRDTVTPRHMIAVVDVHGKGTVSTHEYPDQTVKSIRFIDSSVVSNSVYVLVRNDEDYLIQLVTLE